MKEIVFLTGNQNKLNSAKEVFKKYPKILITNLETETIEIQSLDVVKVAEYAVKEAANRLNMNVFKMDCGYYLEGLNGFPGPLAKYFVNTFSSEEIVKMLEGKSHKLTVKECLSYCEPGGNPISFVASVNAVISEKPEGEEGSSMDKLIIYEGFSTTQAASNYDDIVKYWNENLDHYKRFAEYITK